MADVTQSESEYRHVNDASTFRACQTCRQRKVRCVPIPGASQTCEYCQKHNFHCQPIEPVVKRRRLNTTSELRARIEHLEARLSSRLDGADSPPSHITHAARSEESYSAAHSPMENQLYGHGAHEGQSYMRSSSRSVEGAARSENNSHQLSPVVHSRQGQYLTQTLPLPNFPGPVQTLLNNSHEASGPPRYLKPSPDYLLHHQDHFSDHTTPLRPLQSVSTPSYPNAATPTYCGPADPKFRGSPLSGMKQAEPSGHHYDGSPVDIRPCNSHDSGLTSQNGDEPRIDSRDIQTTRIVGPMAALDEEFYQYCLTKGLATLEDRDCDYKDKLWTRFHKLSGDPALPIYRFRFKVNVASTQLQSDIPPEALKQFRHWTGTFGDILLDSFRQNIAPRLYHMNASQIRRITNDQLEKKPMSMVCASFALAAQCVEDWPIKKRVYLGLCFHQFAMTHLQRDLYPVTIDALHILVLLGSFPLQNDSSLLNSWTLALAFDLRLNIDPQYWQIPDEEKELRRTLFWTIMEEHRWSAVKHLSPTFNHDFYDTKLPGVESATDQMFLCQVQVSEMVANISNSFYSVRGAQMLHHNVEGSSAIGQQLDKTVTEAKKSMLAYWGTTGTDQLSGGTSFALAMLRINLEIATLMIHRPFFESKNISLLDSAEHHRRAAEAATNVVSVLQNMPDSLFLQLWPTHTSMVLAMVAFVLLRESLLSEDATVRNCARKGLVSFMTISRRQSETWYFGTFGLQLMNVAKALTGENYGDVQGPDVSKQDLPPSMANPDWGRLGDVDLSEFQWSDFSQLLGLDSNTLGANWFQNWAPE